MSGDSEWELETANEREALVGALWRSGEPVNVWKAGRDYARQQTDPVREALVTALRDTVYYLDHLARYCEERSPYADMILANRAIDQARAALAAAEQEES